MAVFAALQIVGAPCFRPGGAVLKPVAPSMPGSKFTKVSEPIKDEIEAVRAQTSRLNL